MDNCRWRSFTLIANNEHGKTKLTFSKRSDHEVAHSLGSLSSQDGNAEEDVD